MGTNYITNKPYDPVSDHMMNQFVETGTKFAVGAIGGKTSGKALSKIVSPSLKPLGRGVTGRNTPENLIEQLAMKEIQSNPSLGTRVMNNMNDTRWKGWDKMQYIHKQDDGKKNNNTLRC